jgi:hypothetical protein
MPDINALRQTEAALADAILPDETDSTSSLSDRDKLLVSAYVVLACALVEDFFESCFLHYVDKSLEASDVLFSGCFISLAAKFSDDLLGQVSGIPSAEAAVPRLQGLYKSKVIFPNNGVKRKNLEAMARPLGMIRELEKTCEPLLGPVDTLGARRGSIAHTSSVSEELHPSQARSLVTNVLDQVPLLIALLDS